MDPDVHCTSSFSLVLNGLLLLSSLLRISFEQQNDFSSESNEKGLGTTRISPKSNASPSSPHTMVFKESLVNIVFVCSLFRLLERILRYPSSFLLRKNGSFRLLDMSTSPSLRFLAGLSEPSKPREKRPLLSGLLSSSFSSFSLRLKMAGNFHRQDSCPFSSSFFG